MTVSDKDQTSKKSYRNNNAYQPRLTYGSSPHPKRPSIERYQRLLALLSANQDGISEGKYDKLSKIFGALVGAISFLDEDPLVQHHNLTRQLSTLANALNDLCHGASPSLFQSNNTRPGRPKNESNQAAFGVLACCIDTIISAGQTRKYAAQFVVKEASRIGLMLSGKEVTASGILRLRDEMNGGRASELAQAVYRQICQIRSTTLRLTGTAEKDIGPAKFFVCGALTNLFNSGF